MDSLLKSDIFFFISSLSVVLITVVVVIIGLRILPILRDIRKVVSVFKEEGEKILKDVETVRETIKERSTAAKNTFAIISSFLTPKKRGKTKSANREKKGTE